MKKFTYSMIMQVLVLIWLSTRVKASTEKVFKHHIIYITMQYLEVHDCLNLILQNKIFYTTYRPVMIDEIFQRHHKQLKNPDVMDYNAAYSNLAFIQEVTKRDPIIREVLIKNTTLMLFNGADPSLDILRSDVTGKEQLFNHFRKNKGLFNYRKHSLEDFNYRINNTYTYSLDKVIRLAFDTFALQNGSRLPMVYDPYLATVVCYHKSLDDPTNVVLTLKHHIPAILFFIDKNGEKTHVEQITTCKCTQFDSLDECESKTYLHFKSTTSEYEYVMYFNIKGFLHKIEIFLHSFEFLPDGFMFAEKNKYIKVRPNNNNLNIESIYTSYIPVGSEELYRCFNESPSKFSKIINFFCNIV